MVDQMDKMNITWRWLDLDKMPLINSLSPLSIYTPFPFHHSHCHCHQLLLISPFPSFESLSIYSAITWVSTLTHSNSPHPIIKSIWSCASISIENNNKQKGHSDFDYLYPKVRFFFLLDHFRMAATGVIGGNWMQLRGREERNYQKRVFKICCYSSPLTDSYNTLRVQPGASQSEVKKAFRHLALQVSPSFHSSFTSSSCYQKWKLSLFPFSFYSFSVFEKPKVKI